MKESNVDIVVPAYNESAFLEENILYLYNLLKSEKLPFKWKIIIGENGSKDNTLEIAKKLSKDHKEIEYIHNDFPNRDLILKKAWQNSNSDILLYTDADNSVHPKDIKELVKGIEEGYDIVVGSRFKTGAKVNRALVRVILSNIYNKILLPVILPIGAKDAQCGFKAINQKVAKNLLPVLVKDVTKYSGFLDTELLGVAHSKGYKIKEIPIEWREKRESTMSVWKNIPVYLKNIIKTRVRIILNEY